MSASHLIAPTAEHGTTRHSDSPLPPSPSVGQQADGTYTEEGEGGGLGQQGDISSGVELGRVPSIIAWEVAEDVELAARSDARPVEQAEARAQQPSRIDPRC